MKTNIRQKGSLEVVCGSMFSGKTEELMRRLKRAEFAKQKVLTIKHYIDVRKSHTCIVSHDGKERAAFPIGQNDTGIEQILELASSDIDVVGIDEVQFFPSSIVSIVSYLVQHGKRVIVAGLDLDFRGEPFGTTPILMSLADKVTKLKAVCVVCAQEAHHTQRLINGKAANYDDPIILVSGTEYYEARCRNCFQIDKQPKIDILIQKNKITSVQI
ncbi:MAG: thymidine kinase [bacterium]